MDENNNLEETTNLEEKVEQVIPEEQHEPVETAITENEQPAEKKCGKCPSLSTIISCISLLCVIVLFILHFTGIGTKGHDKVNPNAKEPVVANEGGLKIAYVNTDTLMAKYQYAKDLEKQLTDFKTAKENSYKAQMAQWQRDYEAYTKGGADNMTLAQQQAKEKELQTRLQKLQSLEGEYTMQIQNKTIAESEKMTRAVYNFIREYNAQNQQFDLILARSFSSSPILYGNEGMDITEEIVNGLNAEYANLKNENKEDK